MSDTDKLIKLIHKTFNMYGLSITRKLSIIISKHLLNNPQTKAEEWLSKIVEQILSQNLNTPHITLDHIKIAFQETVKPESHLQNTETVFNVINAFKVPQIVYDLNKKKYVMKEKCQELFPDAKFKSQVFKNRLDLLWFRTLKHAIFAPSKFGKVDENKLELVPIEYLLSESKTNNVCVMGLLAQLTEGQYYLEDYGGAVKVNLKNAFYSSSLIMEGSIVLAQGRYIDGVLEVENIDFPPTESSELGRLNFAEANTFGGPHPTSLRLSEKLKTYIDSNSGNYLIFISEFWVDSENVLNKFKTLLSGFSDYPPVACVLFGHFLSSPVDVESTKKLKEGFKKLASIIAEFSLIQEHTNFVFVPGPYDLSAPKILPRPSIPKCIIENFMKVVPGTHLATNPCRIQYCTREIVAFRENMMSKLCRNTLKYPSKPNEENGEIGEKVYEAFAKSIIRQSHLAPLLFSVSPVYWNHDQALQLYPIPDLVVVADDFQAYSTQYSGCQVINPGPFVKGNFSFKIYIPGEENKVEECNIPEDDS